MSGDVFLESFGRLVGELSLAAAQDRVFVACHPPTTMPYPIGCIDTTAHEVKWKNVVWGCGPVTLQGKPSHRIELLVTGDRLFVFGVFGFSLYLEAFDLETGKHAPLFSTTYWRQSDMRW